MWLGEGVPDELVAALEQGVASDAFTFSRLIFFRAGIW